jgi:mono/diheme cytochrome c family protein
VHLVRNLEAPGGIGEPGTAVTAAAVSNAVFAAPVGASGSCRSRINCARLKEATMPIFSPMIVGLIVGLLAVAGSVVNILHAAPSGTFESIASVLMHPRCINCHQDQSPRQGDARTVHVPLVVRGKDGHGAPTQPCQTCHQATNTADGFVPGVEDWHLAPLSMLWEGRSKEQICEQIKDPARNGGRRTGEQVIEHMKTDPLVLWAWAPGRRTTPPLSHENFVEVLEAWVKAGMPCQ